jgi:uncharacterized membrane protein
MPTVDDVLKLFHILSVIVWVGGGVMMNALALRAMRAAPEKVVAFAQDAAWSGNRIFMPASFSTLAFGLAMVIKIPAYTFGTTWIWLGLVGFALTAVNGGVVLGRLKKKLEQQSEELGPHNPAVRDTATRMVRAMRTDLVIVVLVVVVMVLKPGR